MIATIKSDIRRLFSVRSTYIVAFLTFALIALTSFYIEGYWGQTGSAAGTLQPEALKEIINNSAGLAALFISIIAILQIGHEYRYNTITYTLTANPRRTQVFLSKVFTIGVFSALFGLAAAAFSVVAYSLGVSMRGASLPAQDIDWVVQLSRVAFYSFVYGMLGLMLAILVRNIIGAVVAILLLPTIEPLLGLLLKEKAAYLPISAIDHIMGVSILQSDMTPNKAIVISLAYIVAFGLINWYLFLKRDAN